MTKYAALLTLLLLSPITAVSEPPQLNIMFEHAVPYSGSEMKMLFSPRGISADPEGGYAITDRGDRQIHFCNVWGECEAFGEEGVEVGQFSAAIDIAIDSQGRVLIVDIGENLSRIQVCTRQGSCTSFGAYSGAAQASKSYSSETKLSDVGTFNEPNGIAVDAQDRIIVADTWNHRIQICDAQGSCSAFGSNGEELGQFVSPRGVAVTSDGRIVIADQQNDRIQICDYQGNCSAFGSFGSELGQFDSPWDVEVDSKGVIFVADRSNYRIQACTEMGECSAFGSEGELAGQFITPRHITIDSDDRIYVSDVSQERVQVFRQSAEVKITEGFTDAWYVAETPGQGFFINVFPRSSQMFLSWFTYDTELAADNIPSTVGHAGHRWLTAQGAYQENLASLDIYLTQGGAFGSAQPAADTSADGTMELVFNDCKTGTLNYEITSAGLSGSLDIQRLVDDRAPLCEQLNGQTVELRLPSND